jgi:hypothetical protein
MEPNPPDQGADHSAFPFAWASCLGVYLRVGAAILLFGGAGFGILAARRAVLPYNEEGRYFDAEASVVYHQQAGAVYGMLAVIGVGGGTVLWLLGGYLRGRDGRGGS